MRTLWNITASLLLLIPACTSGEYSTTPPDLALPIIDMTSKPILQNMTGAQCGSKINISSGPYQSCSCTISCTDLGVSCNLTAASDMGESCDGQDNNCNGTIDEKAQINNSATYSSTPLVNGSWDRNCNGSVEYAIKRSTETGTRNLELIYNENCSTMDIDSVCSQYDMSICGSYAVTCVMSQNLCSQTVDVYPCSYSGSCKSATTERLTVLCK